MIDIRGCSGITEGGRKHYENQTKIKIAKS